jgi:hypothetical protein
VIDVRPYLWLVLKNMAAMCCAELHCCPSRASRVRVPCLNPIRPFSLSFSSTTTDAVDAASYTAEFEEFKEAVGKVKKLKIGDEIIENPSDEQLIKAWKAEEVKRALAREEKGEEPLTRPVKDDKGQISYLPPVVTKTSSPEALALVYTRTRARTRTRTRARTCTRTDTNTHTQTHAHTNTFSPQAQHSLMRACTN